MSVTRVRFRDFLKYTNFSKTEINDRISIFVFLKETGHNKYRTGILGEWWTGGILKNPIYGP
jgi:hypothetical protein